MSQEKDNYLRIKNLTLKLGAVLFGVAPLTENLKKSLLLPYELLVDMDYAISFGVALSRKILSTITDRPNQLYYFHYQRVNILIDTISLHLVGLLQNEGYEALPIPASQIADWENQLAHLSHREIAYNAGLGWWGKNNLIVNPVFGAGIRFGTVLTDMPLQTDVPISSGANICASCKRCIQLCPAGAIKEDSFDKNLCQQKLKEFTRTERIGQMICGVCVRACPVNLKRP